jgi:hypothetical protein
LLQLVLVKATEVASSLPHAVRATLPLLRRNEGKIFRLMMVLDMVNEGTAARAPAAPLALSQLLYSRRQHGAVRPSLLLPVKILAECRRRRGLNPLHKATSTTMDYPIQKPSHPNLVLRRLLQTKAAKVESSLLRLLMVLDMVHDGIGAASAPAAPSALPSLLSPLPSHRGPYAVRRSLLLPVTRTTLDYQFPKMAWPNQVLRQLLQLKPAKVAPPLLRLMMVHDFVVPASAFAVFMLDIEAAKVALPLLRLLMVLNMVNEGVAASSRAAPPSLQSVQPCRLQRRTGAAAMKMVLGITPEAGPENEGL